VLLEQLLLGIVALLPFLLVMAGVGAAMLIWFVASAAPLPRWALWCSGWCFPVPTVLRSCCLRCSLGYSSSIGGRGTALLDCAGRRLVGSGRFATGSMQQT